MRAELEWIEKAEQYLAGNLSAQDRSEFEAQLQQDPTRMEQLNFQKQLMKTIHMIALKKAGAKAFKMYRLRRFVTGLGLSALVLSAIGLSAFWWPGSSAEPAPEVTIEAVTEEVRPDQPVTDSSQTVVISQESQHQTTTHEPSDFASDVPHVQNNEEDHSGVSAQLIPVKEEQGNQTTVADYDESISGSTAQKGYEWGITQATSKEELEKIGEEIRRAGGDFIVGNVRYKGTKLVRISFVVKNKDGQVSYRSPEMKAGARICIRFPEDGGISAGWCGERVE